MIESIQALTNFIYSTPGDVRFAPDIELPTGGRFSSIDAYNNIISCITVRDNRDGEWKDYVLKSNSEGETLWIKQVTGSIHALEIDGDNIYIASAETQEDDF